MNIVVIHRERAHGSSSDNEVDSRHIQKPATLTHYTKAVPKRNKIRLSFHDSARYIRTTQKRHAEHHRNATQNTQTPRRYSSPRRNWPKRPQRLARTLRADLTATWRTTGREGLACDLDRVSGNPAISMFRELESKSSSQAWQLCSDTIEEYTKEWLGF